MVSILMHAAGFPTASCPSLYLRLYLPGCLCLSLCSRTANEHFHTPWLPHPMAEKMGCKYSSFLDSRIVYHSLSVPTWIRPQLLRVETCLKSSIIGFHIFSVYHLTLHKHFLKLFLNLYFSPISRICFC